MGTVQSDNQQNGWDCKSLILFPCFQDFISDPTSKSEQSPGKEKSNGSRRRSSLVADLSDVDFDHPFLQAIASKNLEEAKRSLMINPKVARTARDSKGNTAAHIAAFWGLRKELEFLVLHEPDILWSQNEVKNSPVHKAAEAGRIEILDYIRDKDPTLLASKGAMGATPMHLAASHGSLQAVIFLALNNSSLLTMRDRRGFSVVHYAAMHGQVPILAWIAEKRISLLSERSNQGDSPAHLAAMNNMVDALRLIAEKDINTLLHAEDNHGRSQHRVGSCLRDSWMIDAASN